jgi:hypothetical protein
VVSSDVGICRTEALRTTLSVPFAAAFRMSHFQLNPDTLSWREVDGEILALDLAASRYLTSNAAGAVLWKHLAAGATRGELAAALVEEFSIDRDRAFTDVDAFLGDLSEQGLLAS